MMLTLIICDIYTLVYKTNYTFITIIVFLLYLVCTQVTKFTLDQHNMDLLSLLFLFY